MITWCFNAQPNIVRFCITILILGLFLFLYTTLARTKPNVISYMNAFGLAIFVSFIICFIYIFPFSSKNSNEKTQNKELDKPQSLIIAIIKDDTIQEMIYSDSIQTTQVKKTHL